MFFSPLAHSAFFTSILCSVFYWEFIFSSIGKLLAASVYTRLLFPLISSLLDAAS